MASEKTKFSPLRTATHDAHWSFLFYMRGEMIQETSKIFCFVTTVTAQ